MFWMTKMLLINTGYGNADGKLGIAMDPNAPLFVNMSCFHRADGCPRNGPFGRLRAMGGCCATLTQGAPSSRLKHAGAH